MFIIFFFFLVSTFYFYYFYFWRPDNLSSVTHTRNYPWPATRHPPPVTRHPSPAEKSCREKYGYGCLEERASLAGHCSSASSRLGYLTIIPRAQIGSWSIAHEAEGRMGYSWLRGHEGERNNCFSKIQLVGQKYQDKTTLASKTRFSRHCFGFQSRRFLLLVGYNT